jgi:hypothetical protein
MVWGNGYMGLFKSNEEKQALKEHQKKLKAAGRTKLMFMDYVNGHPNLPANRMISIIQDLEKNTLTLSGNLITVTKLEWDEKGSRSVGKAAVGAIVGGVLTGGIGLIAGAAIGGKKNDNSLAILTCTDGTVEYTIYLRANAEKYQKLVSLL